MTETERAKVGHALDLLRDVLQGYVDAAMVEAYGPQWDERVADEDAKRRSSGRRQAVSKSDLAVMLKVIQHERIVPWSNPNTYPDPRIRSFASEILTLRNLFSHGNECSNEHTRLLDTASRFLRLLDLPVPDGLAAPDRNVASGADDEVAVTVTEKPPVIPDLLEREVALLGEPVKRLWEMFSMAGKLGFELVFLGISAVKASQQKEIMEAAVGETMPRISTAGAEVFALLEETYRLEADGDHDSTVQKVLAQLVRCLILNGEILRIATVHYLLDSVPSARDSSGEDSPQFNIALDRLRVFNEWMESTPSDRSYDLIRLANRLDEGSPIANYAIIFAYRQLLKDPIIESEEELRILRDCSARSRMLAAMQPGGFDETELVEFLRLEGKLCNSLGLSDEATEAFTRAAEIVDRYPAADPDVGWSELTGWLNDK